MPDIAIKKAKDATEKIFYGIYNNRFEYRTEYSRFTNGILWLDVFFVGINGSNRRFNLHSFGIGSKIKKFMACHPRIR